MECRVLHRLYATKPLRPISAKLGAEIQSVWVISDGILGNEMRSFALAGAIRNDFCVKPIAWLPILFQKFIVDLSFTKYGKKFLNPTTPWYLSQLEKDKSITSLPFPDLIISCGEKTVLPSLHLRKLAKKTDFVHIGHPGIPFVSFNSVVLQRHEIFKLAHLGPALSQQKGVVITQLALSKLTPEILKDYQTKAHKILGDTFTSKDPHSPIIGILIGNLSPEFSFLSQHAKKLAEELELLVTKFKARVLINYSPRAPAFFKDQIDPVAKRLQEQGFPIKNIPENNQEAYLSALATSSYLVVPLGSVNLLSEAILTRKPVYIVGQEQSKGSLNILGQRAITNGWTRRFRVSPRYRPPGDPLSYIGEHPDFTPISTYPSMLHKAKAELIDLLNEQKEDK
ncbi:hypothetical protein DSO57_1039444 [Entomophthora muscae]|uniref:Uncharacterized protein n=1 Tax=Entomophthora muscae TaxID=34485 RepID=A0ACC2UJ58_9FUNG|nr:hypothetical protein DSO57_1039444 [Entomophthora muscae]